ncbi:MAG: glycosyltransferase family 39 protein [Nitrosomonas sp.]|nr:MAG: glycosyltransferase family 39 protein [Nitrosomonas sp.]
MIQFSIVVPTLNEADNIDSLLTGIFAQAFSPDTFEVIFVDDGSVDSTRDRILAWERHNVRLIERTEKPDLIASILAGVKMADSDVIVVMDADLSHSPEKLAALVQPILANSYDLTIGSRYVAGGSTANWPFYRQFLSRLGSCVARPLCDVNDATSGFFSFRRKLITHIPSQAHGYKILLELLMANHGKIRIKEIPICFQNRTHGSSKLSLTHQYAYIKRLIALAGGTVTLHTAGRFALTGLLGVLIDAAAFQWMLGNGAGLALAHFTSFLLAVTANYVLNSRWTFRAHHPGELHWQQFCRFLFVGALALLFRGGILALLIYTWNVPPGYAIFPAILVTAVINYLGSAFYVFPGPKSQTTTEIRWRTATIGIVAFILLLRLIYSGSAELIPDEAYYWQYAQHLDLSFFDHPPMVAWLIWLGTAMLGHTEFGVRIGALLCGVIALGYLYAFARNLYDKSTAMRATLLWSILPIGFASGLIMLPDAPLIAAWAATLYYMERALVAEQRTAWLGMGIAFGLGLLSKYTLGLLGIAALVFAIIDPKARRWLQRPHPYLAAILAVLLFSPVILWNYNNQWASFAFQSTRVLDDGSSEFAVHYLILHIIILLTPVGFMAAIYAFFANRKDSDLQIETRRHLFIQIFSGIPFLICLLLSTFDQPRFHWTAPIWLAIIPTIAWMIGNTDHLSAFARKITSAWRTVILVCILTYAFVLHYLTLGIPGVPYLFLTEHYFWREAAAEIKQVAEQVRYDSGQEPLIVGMSKWSVASALAFYMHSNSDTNLPIRSRNTLGGSGAMYEFWFPDQSPISQPIIQAGMKKHHIESVHLQFINNQQNNIAAKKLQVTTEILLDQPGMIESRTVMRHGMPVRLIHYRLSDGFKGIFALCNHGFPIESCEVR